MSKSAELWLVRHGATEWSVAKKHTSVTDLSLTPEGEQEARAVAPSLAEVDFDLVLTSPMLRARETATLAGFPEAASDDDLVEWNYGDYEGRTTAEIRETVPGWTLWSHPCPGGERPEQVGARLDRVVERVRRHGGRALVFSHGHTSRALAARWLDLPPTEGRLFVLDTATVSVLGAERGSPAVVRWNSRALSC